MRLVGLLAACLSLTGCETLGYLAQSAHGHFDLMSQRRPIDAVIADASTSPELRDRLARVEALVEFARAELDLPTEGSYEEYVDLKRPYVTWTVVATPPFSMQPKAWCFPVVGCLSYRGYFAREDALAYAARLEAQGLDTYVGGATAYSTLGWFDDPVLSTMTRRGEAGLAAVLFHELAHQRLYLAGDTTFNESYAVALERIGVRLWFERRGAPDALAAYEARLRKREAFTGLVAQAKQRLELIYAGPESEARKQLAKAAVFEWMRSRHAQLAVEWGGRSPYQAWFDAPLNNAKLALIGTYAEFVAPLLDLYAASGNRIDGFHAAVEELAALSREERHRQLSAAVSPAR